MSLFSSYIKSKFSKLATTITQVETTVVELCRVLELVKNVESELNVAHGKVGDNVFAKLQSVLHRNEGYK
jgi:chaperonin cofactor prefoldin